MAEIKLTKGQIAIVDDELFEELNKYSWCVIKDVSINGYYAIGSVPSGGRRKKLQYMHRYVATITGKDIKGKIVDHINHATLDNRKDNLRICTTSENTSNRRKRSDNTSGVTGIYWNSKTKKWFSSICKNQKQVSLGHFTNKDDAIKARKEAEQKIFKEYRYQEELDAKHNYKLN